MDTAYVLVTVLTILATGAIAAADLARAEFVLANSAGVGVPESWLTTSGCSRLPAPPVGARPRRRAAHRDRGLPWA